MFLAALNLPRREILRKAQFQRVAYKFLPYKNARVSGREVKQMKTGCKYITLTKRRDIEKRFAEGWSKQEIADYIGMSVRTVYRELQRGKCIQRRKLYDEYGFKGYKYYETYSADIAQGQYELNMTAKGRPLKIGNDYEFVRYMEERVIKDKIKPRAVLGEIGRKKLSFKTQISRTTLYRYIRMGLFPHIEMAVRSEDKKKYEHAKVKRAPRGTSIEMRPHNIAARNEFGHWEMDCICCDNKAVFLTMAERYTRFMIAFKMESQQACNVVRCLNKLERSFGKDFKRVFKTITVDNGSEFSDCASMERSIYNKKSKRVKLFYCHPYSAYERGTNERLNREVRRLVPKGTDLTPYTQAEVQAIVKWVNDYPREIFGFATSAERFKEELAALGLTA